MKRIFTENTAEDKTVATKVLGVLRAILTPVICIVLAFVIWSFSINESKDNYDRIFTVTKLSVNGTATLAEKNHLSVIEQPQVNLEITVSGLRKDVIKLTAEDFAAYIDVSGLTQTGRHTVEISVNQPSTVKIVSITPATVDIQIDEIKTVQKEVVPQLISYNIESSYRFGTLTCETASVEITGPASVVDRIRFLRAEVSLGQVSTSMVCMANLVPMISSTGSLEEQYLQYVTCAQKGVQVKVPVIADVTVPLEWALAPDVDPATVASVVFSAESVKLTGDPKSLRGLEKLTVFIVRADTFGTYQIRFSEIDLPEGVSFAGSGEGVSVTVVRREAPPETVVTEAPTDAPTEVPTEAPTAPETSPVESGLFGRTF